MENRFVKITLILSMLLVMAIPTQAFAAEKCSLNSPNASNNNYSKIYTQLSQTSLSKLKEACTQFSTGKIDNAQLQNLLKQMNSGTKQAVTPTATAKPVATAATPATAKLATPATPTATAKPVATPAATPATPTATAKPAATPAIPTETAKPAATPAKSPTPVAPAAPTQTTTTETPVASNMGAYEQQVVDLVNKERAAAGLSALKVNTKLAGVAEKKAEDLRDKNYFAHQSPTYGSPFDMMKQFGISYSSAGENIAKGQKTPASVMNGWMNSQGHKDNILNTSFTEIGVGYVTDSNGNTYWVQMFIRP